MNKFIKLVKESRLLQLILAMCSGVIIGAVFYPTKSIREEERSLYEQKLAKVKDQHSVELSTVKQDLQKRETELKTFKQESEKKTLRLTQQISDLKSKQKTAYYKLIKPDGTVEIKKFSESEVTESTKVISQIQEEFRLQISSLESRWSEIHEKRVSDIKKTFDTKESEYQTTIAKLEKEKKIEINQKRFGVEFGYTSSSRYYVHSSADIVGPVFFGLHGEIDSSFLINQGGALGFGLGIRF
jgi:hypothetical protein